MEDYEEQRADMMDVLLVRSGRFPERVEIGTGLRALQKAVDGCIEVVYPFEDPVGLIVNEEGKLIGLPPNRALRGEEGRIEDVIMGDFLIAGLGDEGEFCSLSPELMERYEREFHCPEVFVRMGRSIMAIRLEDELIRPEPVSEIHIVHMKSEQEER